LIEQASAPHIIDPVGPGAPTILLVHAHPDDEASTTGGTIARYAAAGARVVLVTCTNGEYGNSAAGHAPDHEDHDAGAVVAHRMAELEASCAILGVSRLVLLGYHDSGMMGWPQNEAPGAFWNTPVADAAARLAELLEEERPDVVITYDENGFYGHPDHIQANRITLAAIKATSLSPKLYYPAIPLSAFKAMAEAMATEGIEGPQGPGGEDVPPSDLGTPDDQIGAVIDVSAHTAAKRAALAAHGSQTEGSFFLTLPEEVFERFFGTESYVRVQDPTGQVGVEDDLLAGTPYAALR
jgi:N-acetyl-1-D-myo-inositol-2-amino-2-deoxy-alpha-D-glucopyranoside deacetylase